MVAGSRRASPCSNEWRPRSFIPVAAAVVVSTLCRGFLLGTAPVFGLPAVGTPGPVATGLALVPGITGGLLAIAATGMVYFAEDCFTKLPLHWMWWPAVGGLIVGVGGLVEPRALGVGYDVIDQLRAAAICTRNTTANDC